jgi:predicted aldo/keto reductase-like oxidoreductase
LDYRPFSKTNLSLSALSYGCMRFADDDTAAEAVRKAIELGINYFDVAPAYCGRTSERRLAAGIKGADRSKLIITAKSSPGDGGEGVGQSYGPEIGFGINTADQARAEIERSMKIIGVDHLDVYHLWAIHSDRIFDEAMKPGGFLEGVRKAQAEGLFDYVGMTTHMPADNIIGYLKRFDFDMITLPFHLRDTSRAKAIDFCAERGIGVIAMNPLAGGALAKPAQPLQALASGAGCESMTEASLRYLLGYPGITTALVGFTYADQVSQDVAMADRGGLSSEARQTLESRIQELYANVKHFCSACGYCGECPEGILIPKVLEVYSNLLVPSAADAAREELVQRLLEDPQGHDPSLCVACGQCEPKCPNNLPISELMVAAKEKWPGK